MRISDWSSDVCSSDLLDISVPTDRHRPIEFLTSDESIQWVAQRGLAADPVDSGPEFGYFQFVPQPLPVTVRELICALLEALGGFSGGLLLLTDWIWDDEYDADPTAGCRSEERRVGNGAVST